MLTHIKVNEKKDFIIWFLNSHNFRNRESRWIFEYIINHQEILNNIHFVRSIKECPRAAIISSECSDNIPLLFCKKSITTTDAEIFFHDIRLYKEDELYVQLNFEDSIQNPLYVNVLEDNPYIKDDIKEIRQFQLEAERLLQLSLYSEQKNMLETIIDQSLDQMDNTLFTETINKLKQLELKFKKEV